MKPTKIPLELIVPYWGSKIKYTFVDKGRTYTSENAVVDLDTLKELHTFPLTSVLLYLKPLTKLSDEEVLKIANWVVASEAPVKFDISENEDSIQASNSVYFIDIFLDPFFISIVNLGDMETIEPVRNLGLIFNYLRSKSFDVDQLIRSGRALEIE
jgi:hypothetical protein